VLSVQYSVLSTRHRTVLTDVRSQLAEKWVLVTRTSLLLRGRRRRRCYIPDCCEPTRKTQNYTVSDTSPADRVLVSDDGLVKIPRQVQSSSSNGQYKGVWRSLVRMWNEEGFAGFMRGNGINCLRIVPYSAVQFTTYEQLKKVSEQIFTSSCCSTTKLADSFSPAMGLGNSIPQHG
jgi:hypothetical protein